MGIYTGADSLTKNEIFSSTTNTDITNGFTPISSLVKISAKQVAGSAYIVLSTHTNRFLQLLAQTHDFNSSWPPDPMVSPVSSMGLLDTPVASTQTLCFLEYLGQI